MKAHDIVEQEVFSLTNNMLDQLHALDVLCLPDQAWTIEAWKSLTIYGQNYNLWTITEENKIIATMLVLNLEFEQMLHLLKIMVHPDYRKRGLAQNLIDRLKTRAQSQEFNSVMLEVEADNLPAITLYQTAGFKLTRRVKKFYSNGKDALVMNCAIYADRH